MTNPSDPDPRDTPTDPRELSATATPLDLITRWELFGGAWRVIARTGDQVTISLCRCDGGEEQQRLTSDEPALTAWLGDRTSSTPTSTGPPH